MRGLAHVWLCVAVAAALGTTAAGQLPRELSQPPIVFKSTTRLVALSVTVQDARSRYIRGLGLDDFAVYEDGRKQAVRFFESTAIPVDLILLIDRSTSMAENQAIVGIAARGLIGTLRDCDRGAVVTFSQRVSIAQPLTHDRDALAAAIDAGPMLGYTALHSALYIALKEFGLGAAREGAVRRQAIAVLSDGEDNASLVSFDDVIDQARQVGVNIYTVRLRAAEAPLRTSAGAARASAADYEMTALARETGALSYFPTPDQLGRVYASIAEEVASQYSIGYEPAVSLTDGLFHRISVQVVGNPELRARTRSGYRAATGTRNPPGQ